MLEIRMFFVVPADLGCQG